ncbi:MAG: hypothetical protein ACTSQM_05510, partial [Candidatus Odinarchaeia archaeon]
SKEAVEMLKIHLAKNPKYAILFLLQDIQKASVEELAKTVAKQANLMASFAKMHSNVKKILSKWCKSSICAHLTTTKLGRSRKTKEVYHFSPSGLDILKRKVITFTIKRIREKNKFQPNILKPREIIIDSILNRLKALKI